MEMEIIQWSVMHYDVESFVLFIVLVLNLVAAPLVFRVQLSAIVAAKP